MRNKITLVGRLGGDPDLRVTSNMKQYARFTVATSEKYTDKEGNKHEKTEWHAVKVWGDSADKAKAMLKKGSKVYVEGTLRSYIPNPEQQPNDKKWEIISDFWLTLEAKTNQDTAQQYNQQFNQGGAPQQYSQPAYQGAPPQQYNQQFNQGGAPQQYSQPAYQGAPPWQTQPTNNWNQPGDLLPPDNN